MDRVEMKRAGVFGAALVAVWLLNGGEGAAQNCPPGCVCSCPATQKDAKGCCAAKPAPTPNGTGGTLAPPKPNPPRPAAPKVRCPNGSVLRGGRCVGLVECPEGFAFEQGKCRPLNAPTPVAECPEGFAFEQGKCRPLNAPTPAPSGRREGMVYVEAGEFIRGAYEGDEDEDENEDEDEYYNDKPTGKVWLDGYWIDTYEVTVGEYAACVKAGKCTVPKQNGGEHDNWGADGPRWDRPRHPINGVDWEQAAAYCAWKGKRLPTEAEWEKAARGVDGRTYPWGEAEASCKFAVMADGGNGCGKDRTWEVGSKPAGVSPYGAHDMAGNVWEWTADWYDEDYYASTAGRGRNPTGPRSGSERVVRGGSWVNDGGDMRASDRYLYAPSVAGGVLGFRCSDGEGLDRATIKRVVGGAYGSVRSCGGPGKSGTVKVRFTVQPNGSVSGASIVGFKAGTPEGNCVLAAVRGLRFPVFSGSAKTITYPLVLP